MTARYTTHRTAKKLNTTVATVVRMVKMGWLKLDSEKMISSDQIRKIKASVEARGSLDAALEAMARGLPDGAISIPEASRMVGCAYTTMQAWSASGRYGIVASGRGVTLDSVLVAQSQWERPPWFSKCAEIDTQTVS
jgi:hypothetical protein